MSYCLGDTEGRRMPVRRSLDRAPALLVACLANSRKSGGPRTPRGLAGSCLNALKDGHCAKGVRRLVLARRREVIRLYDFVLGQLYLAFEPQTPFAAAGAERLAAQACCWLRVRKRAIGPGTKPECVLESTVSQSTLPSRIGWAEAASSAIRLQSPARLRIEISAHRSWAGEPNQKNLLTNGKSSIIKACIGCVSFSGCQTT